MPTYYAAGVNIRLSTTSVAASLTPTSIKSITGNDPKEPRRIDSAFSAADTLSESLLSLSLNSTEADDQLHFLGDDPPVPFYCVGVQSPVSCQATLHHEAHASEPDAPDAMEIEPKQTASFKGVATRSRCVDASSSLSSLGSTPFSSPQLSEVRGRGSLPIPKKITLRKPKDSDPADRAQQSETLDPRLTQPNSPIPLIMTVNLNKLLSYSRTFDSRQKSKDIKIDVFYNGKLTHSSYVSERHKNDIDKTTFHYSGMRIDRLAEAAWLIYPVPDEKIRKSDKEITSAVESLASQRWDQIAVAISAEANILGLDESRSRPPAGEYLHNLSKLQIPPAVVDYANTKDQTFGVIDVVITLGSGKKYPVTHGFLKQPQRLKDPRFQPDTSTQPAKPHNSGNTEKDGNMDLSSFPSSGDSKIPASAGSCDNDTAESKEKYQTLASTRSRRVSIPSIRARLSGMDNPALGVKSRIHSSPVSCASAQDQNQDITSTGSSKEDENEAHFPKKRRRAGESRLLSGPVKYTPVQLLARRPSRNSNQANLGHPRIFFPDLDANYFKGDAHNQENGGMTAVTEPKCNKKSNKKSLIVKLKVPMLAQKIKSRGKAEETTLSRKSKRNSMAVNAPSNDAVTETRSSSPNPTQRRRVKLELDSEPPLKLPKTRISLASHLNGPACESPTGNPAPVAAKDTFNSTELETGEPKVIEPSSLSFKSSSPMGQMPSKMSTKAERRKSDVSNTNEMCLLSTPELSRNCILSYMPPSSGETGQKRKAAGTADKTGAVRYRRSERTGEFVEQEVLLGCRYIVGG